MKIAVTLLAAASLMFAADPTTPPAAKPKAETLRFTVNWPSGLSLGEGELTATPSGQGWTFAMNVEAAIPAFGIAERARAQATADLCSAELEKTGTRGKREVTETTKFDASALTATRQTGKGGGKTEMRINACAKDALTFLQFLRRELAAGRLPQAQPVYYGSGYQTRVQYTGTQRIVSGSEAVDADKLTLFIKGPSSEFTVEVFFARDAGRTPIKAEIPFAVGKFTVEFSR